MLLLFKCISHVFHSFNQYTLQFIKNMKEKKNIAFAHSMFCRNSSRFINLQQNNISSGFARISKGFVQLVLSSRRWRIQTSLFFCFSYTTKKMRTLLYCIPFYWHKFHQSANRYENNYSKYESCSKYLHIFGLYVFVIVFVSIVIVWINT